MLRLKKSHARVYFKFYDFSCWLVFQLSGFCAGGLNIHDNLRAEQRVMQWANAGATATELRAKNRFFVGIKQNKWNQNKWPAAGAAAPAAAPPLLPLALATYAAMWVRCSSDLTRETQNFPTPCLSSIRTFNGNPFWRKKPKRFWKCSTRFV